MKILADDLEKCEGGLMIHADGKKMNQHGEIVERFPVVLSGFADGKAHVIAIPTVENGKGITMAQKAKEVVESVEAEEFVVGVVADTTTSITGIYSGMFKNLEDLFRRPLLKSPCRHHSDDLLEKSAFKSIFGPTKSPAKSDFLEFRKIWPTLNLDSVTPRRNSFSHPFMLHRMKTTCYEVLADANVRSDRKELAQQTLDINGYVQPSRQMARK